MTATITFNERTKHGKLDFHPGVAYQFENADAVAYFKAAGWASDAPANPQHVVTISKDEIAIDPDTVFGTGPNRGQKVLGGKGGDGSINPARGKLG